MRTRTLFGHNKAIERNIDDLLDKISETGMLVVATVHHQLEAGRDEAVEAKIVQVAELKRTCSRLRREALPVNELYNKQLRQQLDYVFEHFRTSPRET